MCGIAGWFGAPPDPETLAKMTAAVAHRGPDDVGTASFGEFSLGHRRLAVIDPSPRGRQPLAYGALRVVFNGELYNYPTLRDGLSGHDGLPPLVTGTDTEVLLAVAARHGVGGLLDRADGMFAFALVDTTTGHAWLARDRAGEKPLYYAILGRRLLFGSELTALLAHPALPRDLDPAALRRFLLHDAVPAPRSVLKHVRKLEPGTVLEWHDGQISIRRWAQPLPTGPTYSSADAPAALWRAVGDAVESRLVSDVPLGFSLSGGLDSTAVVVAAAERRPAGSLDTFTVGFDDPSFDETAHAQAVATHLGTRHHAITLDESRALELVPTLGDLLDEPHADASILPTLLLSRFTRDHVTVALSGDGGDELLLGYPTFAAHAVALAAEKVPGPLRRGLLAPLVNLLPASEKNWSVDYQLRRFLDGMEYGRFERHVVWIGGTAPRDHRHLFEPAVYAAAETAPIFDDVDSALRGTEGLPDLDRLGHLYARLYLADGVLQKVDRASMRYGLESRAPLLAKGVLEVAARIAASDKLSGNPLKPITKVVLRRALRGKVPDAILDRPKKGFGVPMTRWLKGPLKPIMKDVFDAVAIRTQAIFKAEVIEKLMAEHDAGFRDHRKTLWPLLVFQLWARRHGYS